MTTWLQFRERCRRMLDDVVDGAPEEDLEHTDAGLLDAFSFALVGFASHTAPQKSVVWDGTTEKEPGVFYDMLVDREFTLPLDIFDNPELTSRVSVIKPAQAPLILPWHGYTKLADSYSTPNTFRTFGDKLVVNARLAQNDVVRMEYFGYYDPPVSDGDTITIPMWAEVAVSYLTCYHALTHLATKASATGEFRSKGETGVPEQNAWRQQQKYMNLMYDTELSRRPYQARRMVYGEV